MDENKGQQAGGSKKEDGNEPPAVCVCVCVYMESVTGSCSTFLFRGSIPDPLPTVSTSTWRVGQSVTTTSETNILFRLGSEGIQTAFSENAE